jgi:hypothetical protein
MIVRELGNTNGGLGIVAGLSAKATPGVTKKKLNTNILAIVKICVLFIS